MGNSGKIIKTTSGKLGIVYDKDMEYSLALKKLVVHVIDEDHNPVLNDKGNQIKILVSPENAEQIGFTD